MSTLIRVENLTFAYEPGKPVLNNVNFELKAGESVAVFGYNGSGKTTFLLHLNGLLRGEGKIVVCGQELQDSTLRWARAKVGLVFQDPDEQLFMPTVLEEVCFGLLNQGLGPEQAKRKAEAILAELGIGNLRNKPPYLLSAGEKRKVALASVLVMDPEVLVLDEPTTYLDPPAKLQLLHLLRGLPQAKILVTHDIEFARALCTRAIFFENGQITAAGPVDLVLRDKNWETPLAFEPDSQALRSSS